LLALSRNRMNLRTQKLESVVDQCLRKIDRTIFALDGQWPHLTKNGVWENAKDGGWTGGFWVGLLWLSYELTGEGRYRDSAFRFSRQLEPLIERAGSHKEFRRK